MLSKDIFRIIFYAFGHLKKETTKQVVFV